MENLLYYPYINLPRIDWAIRVFLYYEQVNTIVPQNYFLEPERYEEFTRELVRNDLVTPLNPMEVLDNPWEALKPFIDYLHSAEFKVTQRSESFRKKISDAREIKSFNVPRIHVEKFDNKIFFELEQAGLAKREDFEWFSVEQKTANELMSYLASVISGKLNLLPVTDVSVRKSPFNDKLFYKTKSKENIRREIILRELIPFPEQIDLNKLRKFKDKYYDLLCRFRNSVELIALDHNIDEKSQLFYEKIKELEYNKDEISSRMKECKLGPLILGTVSGFVGAVIGFTIGDLPSTTAAVFSLANAISSALQIEGATIISDRSGMKYLALADKKLRK